VGRGCRRLGHKQSEGFKATVKACLMSNFKNSTQKQVWSKEFPGIYRRKGGSFIFGFQDADRIELCTSG
jgi:hypothetical protein